MVIRFLLSFLLMAGMAFSGPDSSAATYDPDEDPQVGTKPKGTYFQAVVLDSLTHAPIEFGTMHATYIGDKQPRKYALSDAKGVVVLQGLPVGRATITFEYMGYNTKTFTYDIKKGENNYGKLLVSESTSQLNEVVVTGVANPVVVKQDTVEYNASSFKVNETDMLEELIKKLPGVEIGSDGKITANGKDIKKIMIDGKTFFMDDPALATKNLPAKMVDKLRIVDRKSDQTRFTGIDDGEEETVLDLGIKAGMMNGWFGNLGGGYGYGSHDHRYEAAAMVGKFNKKTQISIIANGNNTNNRGFSDIAGSMMYSMGLGGSMWGGGESTSWLGGANVSTELIDGKMDLSGNLLYSGTDVYNERTSTRVTMLPQGVNMTNNSKSVKNSTSDGWRFGADMEYNISDNTFLLFRPSFNIGHATYDSNDDFSTLMGADSTNRGYSSTSGDNDSQQFGGRLMFRQKLGKPGRNISLSVDYQYSNSDMVGFNRSLTNFFQENSIDSTAAVDQKYFQNERSNSISGRITYAEPLGKNFFIQGMYRYNYRKTNSSKDTYGRNGGEEYDQKVRDFTSHYENTFITQQANLSLMKQEKKYNFNIGVSYQPSRTKSLGYGVDTTYRDTAYTVSNFSPFARLDFRFSKSKNLKFRYRGRTSQPSINQLMPIADNSDPLHLTVGNKNLKPEFTHRAGIEYNTNNHKNFSWLHAALEGTFTSDNIVARKYYTQDGVLVSTFGNTDRGIFSVNGRLMYNTVIAKSDFSVSTMTYARYGTGVSYVESSRMHEDEDIRDAVMMRDYQENLTRSLSVSERLKFTYRNDWAEVTVHGRASYQDAWYTVENMKKVATWTNSVGGSVNFNIPGGLNISSDINHTFYIGYDEGYAKNNTIWNASLSKSLFKNAATLKIKVYDILRDTRNVRRTATENYIQDVSNNQLGQYAMLTFTWRFGKFGGKSMYGSYGRGYGGYHGGYHGGYGGYGKRR